MASSSKKEQYEKHKRFGGRFLSKERTCAKKGMKVKEKRKKFEGVFFFFPLFNLKYLGCEKEKMKTKNKILAAVEIAIVLCSVFFMALSAIATEQNQEMQKVSAHTITTASDDDYVLGIYGNANEDDTIDMRDLTYVKLIFFGKKPETELADAKYDDKINPLDFIQIKLIIVGKERELTIIHGNGRAKTFNLPIKRIIAIDDGQGEPLRVLEAEDLVAGVGTGLAGRPGMRRHETILPKMHKLPVVGGSGGEAMNIDYEKVLSLKPDLFFTHAGGVEEGLEEKLEPYGVQVLYLSCCPIRKPDDIIKLGYLLGKVNKAKEVVDFWEGYVDKIKARTDGLPEDEKSRVFITYIGWDMTCSKGTKGDEVCTIVGGVNIAHDVIGSGTWSMYPVVDREWVVEQNPDVIITTSWGGRGYETDDPSEMEAAREEIMNRPELTNVNAVKNGNVYAVSGDFTSSGLLGIVWAAYMAKWFYPDLFEDFDPQAIHQEYIDRFLRIDYDLDKHGVFIYPPLED